MKNEILNIGIEKINQLVGIECRLLKEDLRIKNKIIDAEIVIKREKVKLKYFVEIKRKIVPDQVPKILEMNQNTNPMIYFADYITPKAKEILRLNNIPYVDTAGNMFLNNQNIYIHIQTEKTNRKETKTHTRAFNKAGLKVVYQFLINPEYLNMPYRFIGDKAKVTIATVGVVFKNLLKERYIVQTTNKEYQFLDREKLFEEWVKEYNRNLKPKLKNKRYRWLNKNKNWKNIKLPVGTYWGGATAAELLTEYLIADRMEIYTDLQFQEVMKALKIIPDVEGEITVTEMFWKDQEENNMVNPILIYADLLHDTNPRYLETANIIYKEYVQDNL